jgi:uncharacterized RDD family membrane protein YckC
MLNPPEGSEPGWYRTPDDPPGTHRYWDGESWIGDAEPVPGIGDRRASGIDQPLAGAGHRLLARLVDTLITVMVFMLVTALVDGDIGDGTPSALASLLGLLFSAGYEIVLTSTFGGTVGKLMLGMRVVETTGTTPPGIECSARRWAPNLLTVVPVLGPIAGLAILVLSLAWITSDPDRRSVFDRAGRTVVVKGDSPRRGDAWRSA